jgi:hypothetical protein
MTRLIKSKALDAQARTATKHGVRVNGRNLVDEVMAAATRLPVRDRQTLHEQFPGRSPNEVADALVRSAVRATGTVGAAVGASAVLPFVLAFPVEVAAETLAVVGIEIRLVAELHEVYGMGVSGSVPERMSSYVAAWAGQGSAVLAPGSLVLAVGSPLRKRVSRKLARRAGRSTLTLAPLLLGAAVGTLLNRRETRRVARKVLANLRQEPGVRWQWD